jgi:pimeloyl-ACP methyl ester carboxylesterase
MATLVVCTLTLGLTVPVRHHDFAWPGRTGLRLHYTSAVPVAPAQSETPIVFLPGFGVGTFHFEAQLERLGHERPAYALDWLGQGESWPEDDGAEVGLRYDADLWRDQLEVFIEQQLGGGPVLLAGNSLGGFIGVQLALKRPDLVAGLALMNATPLWSFAPPISERDAWRPFGWDATLPPPRAAFAIGSRWFDTLRNPATIATMLGGVYADKRTVRATINRPHAPSGDLPSEIAKAASKRGGHAAFTSILFSPKAQVSFEDALLRLSVREAGEPPLPIALLYGREDPWVVPLWAERAHRRAAWPELIADGQSVADGSAAILPRCDVVHYALSPAGHCPHHEAPELVNELLRSWAKAVDAPGSRIADLMPAELQTTEAFGRSVRAFRRDGEPLGPIEALAKAFDRLAVPMTVLRVE